MSYKAIISITLRPSILDPEGKTVHQALHNLGHTEIGEVRVGKRIELTIDADTPDAAHAIAESACDKLLANPVMENYTIAIDEQATEAAA